MAIFDDFKGIYGHYKKSSGAVRIWLLLSTFLATSSVASISDTIIKWRGFVSTGLEFYNNYVTESFINTFSLLGIHISLVQTNYLIISSLMISGIFRINKVKYYTKFTVLLFIYCLGIGGLYIFDFIALKNIPEWVATFACYIPVSFFFKEKDVELSEKINFFTPLLLALFIVLIGGGINVGFSSSI